MIRNTASVVPGDSGIRKPKTVGHPSGQHLLADLFGVNSQELLSEKRLLDLFMIALESAGCTILSHTSHKFDDENAGVTGLILLSESHASFHTYPEHEFLAMDVFVCGQVDPATVLSHIAEHLKPKEVVSKIERRGMQVHANQTS